MKPEEATALVTMMLAHYPGVRFDVANPAAFESKLLELGAQETQAAIDELIGTMRFIPTVADIKGEVMRARRAKESASANARRMRLGGPSHERIGPKPEEWAKLLSALLEASARWRRMAEPFYAAKGKACPPDPGMEFIELARAGSAGQDVDGRMRAAVIPGDQDEQERRHP